MSEAAHQRIRDRIAHLAPRLQIVTVPEAGRYQANGAEVAAAPGARDRLEHPGYA